MTSVSIKYFAVLHLECHNTMACSNVHAMQCLQWLLPCSRLSIEQRSSRCRSPRCCCSPACLHNSCPQRSLRWPQSAPTAVMSGHTHFADKEKLTVLPSMHCSCQLQMLLHMWRVLSMSIALHCLCIPCLCVVYALPMHTTVTIAFSPLHTLSMQCLCIAYLVYANLVYAYLVYALYLSTYASAYVHLWYKTPEKSAQHRVLAWRLGVQSQ